MDVESSNQSNPPGVVLQFVEELRRQDVARMTLVNYHSDLLQFVRWFELSRGEPFAVGVSTPTDVRDYRSLLVAVEG